MPVSDLDIARAAHLCIQQHGDQATAHARSMVATMRRKGDVEGADTWLRIIVAIELGKPPTDTRHAALSGRQQEPRRKRSGRG